MIALCFDLEQENGTLAKEEEVPAEEEEKAEQTPSVCFRILRISNCVFQGLERPKNIPDGFCMNPVSFSLHCPSPLSSFRLTQTMTRDGLLRITWMTQTG